MNVEVKENGDVYVNNQKDEDGEVIIKGGSGTNTWSNKSSTNAEKQKAEEPQEEPSIGESYPVEEKTEEEPAAEQPEPEDERTGQRTGNICRGRAAEAGSTCRGRKNSCGRCR